jgi:hypothetical protein
MASTYSALKIELIGTGEQSGTWGTTTNNNLGNDALGEAITGSADVTFASANVTVTLTDTNASQAARNLRLNLIGTTGGARDLILGSGCQIEKLYLINNTCADAITVKNTSGTGVAVAAGKSTFVFNNGTNVVDAVTQFNGTIALATGVSGVLPVANGGTGISSLGAGVATWLGTPSSANLAAALTDETGSGSNVFATSPTLVTPVLGVATATSVNKVALTAPATGSTLTIADGKTLTASNSLTLAGTDATTMTFPPASSKIGYLNIPPVGTKTGSYTLAVGDIGEYVQVGSGGSITIPNATFAEGDAISIFNNTSGNITITCTITTAYIAGTDSDKASVTLATRGVCTILFISGTVCVITGNVT